MLARFGTGAVGIPLLTYVALADSLWPARILALALGTLAVFEYLRAEKALMNWWVWVPFAAFVPLVLAVTPTKLFILIFFPLWFAYRLIVELRDNYLRKTALVMAPFFWILAPIWLLVALRAYDMPSGESLMRFAPGSDLMLLFICLWVSDTAAMLVGRYFGRHKIAPDVSPNKTWEGAIANLLAALIVGLLVALPFGVVWWVGLCLGAIAGVFGQLGDFAESRWKRSVGIKDSGAILPGHGGVLARFDSFLYSAPPVVLLLNYA